MGYEANTGLNVFNHYGPRDTGNAEGVTKTEGYQNEVVINFDGENFPLRAVIPAGSVVTDIDTSFATGAVTAATVGLVDISDAGQIDASVAGDTKPVTVPVPLGGNVTVTGPTAGSVIVRYTKVAI